MCGGCGCGRLVPSYVFCNNGCSCVRSSLRFLKLWLQIALEWLHECCMGFVLGRKPEHKTLCFSPQLCVGFLFLILYPEPPPPPPPSARLPPPTTTLSHTLFHIQLLHRHKLNTQLCHIPSVTYTITSHTQTSHTIFHIQ